MESINNEKHNSHFSEQPANIKDVDTEPILVSNKQSLKKKKKKDSSFL